MNNSFIATQNVSMKLEDTVDLTVPLKQREIKLVKILEAIDKVSNSSEWLTLKHEVFDGVVESLIKNRDTEVEKKPLNGPMIHSLNGQLAWAKKYSNLASLADIYKQELSNTRKALNGK